MKLYWKNNRQMAEIGSYECVLEDDDGYTQTIHIRDNTCEFCRKEAAKDPITFKHYHPYAFEVDYCHGYSMSEGFDETWTLERVKIWAEDYLLNGLINNYNHMKETIGQAEQEAIWAQEFKNSRNK